MPQVLIQDIEIIGEKESMELLKLLGNNTDIPVDSAFRKNKPIVNSNFAEEFDF